MALRTSVRVAVNGYGVIGKRVADAVALQDDMQLVGVAEIVSDYHQRVRATLTARRAGLVALAQLLIEREVVDHDQLAAVLGGERLAPVPS